MSFQTTPLSEITTLITKGTTPTTLGQPFTDIGINFVKAEALNGDTTLLASGFSFISNDTHKLLKRSQLEENDVLITIAGANIGKCGWVRKENLPANTNQAVGIVRIDDKKAIPRYVYYCFKNPIMLKTIQNLNAQAAQPNLNLTNLGQLEIPLPDINNQKEIAGTLGLFDDLIIVNDSKIRTLENSVSSIYKEWFVNFKLPSHENVKMIDSGHPDFEMIPVGWSICKVGNILSNNPKSEKLKTTDYLQSGKFPVVDQGQDFIAGYTNNLSAVISETYPIIVFGDHTRSLKLINFPFARGADGTQLLISNKKEMPQHLFYQSLKYLDLSNQHYARHFKFLKESVILIPTEEIAIKYESIADKIYSLIYNLKLQNDSLTKIRDLLLPKLISGEIDVSEVSEINIEKINSKKLDSATGEGTRL